MPAIWVIQLGAVTIRNVQSPVFLRNTLHNEAIGHLKTSGKAGAGKNTMKR
jgi:hypothetical protein